MTILSLTEADYVKASIAIGCEVAAIKAVTFVESRGSGFDPEGFPITLFEGHWFHKFTAGRYAAMNPSLSYPKWTREFYGKTWKIEKQRLQQACALDRPAALMSASWGMFQIMGFNYAKCGYSTLQEFVTAMCASEGEQLLAFSKFVQSSRLTDALKSKDWKTFAYRYNGPEFAKNQYDTKLSEAYNKYTT